MRGETLTGMTGITDMAVGGRKGYMTAVKTANDKRKEGAR